MNFKIKQYCFGVKLRKREKDGGLPLRLFDQVIGGYVSRLNNLTPAETKRILRPPMHTSIVVAGGVYSLGRGDGFLGLFYPGSRTKGVKGVNWKIPFPAGFRDYCFCPSGNVIAFFEIPGNK